MAMTIELDIPADPNVRARQSIIRSILKDLVAHSVTLEEAVKSIDHLTIAAANVPRREYNGGDTPPI